MSTSRITFGAVLDTVQTTATTVTNVLDAANSSIGMVNTFITSAAENQKIRAIADKETFIEDLIREKAFEQSASTLRVNSFMSQSAEHKNAFQNAYNTYSTLLRPQAEANPA